METEKTHKYNLIHPISGEYIEVRLYGDEKLRQWKPYLDKIEKWFNKQRLDKAYDELLK